MSALFIRMAILVCSAILFGGCTASVLKPHPEDILAATPAGNDEIARLRELRAELNRDPYDAELRARYHTLTRQVIESHVASAQDAVDAGDLSRAEAELGRGLAGAPESSELKAMLQKVYALKKADEIVRDGLVALRQGDEKQARRLIGEALKLDADNIYALAVLKEIKSAIATRKAIEPVRLSTAANVSLNFRNASFKDSLLALGKAYGVNIIFDPDIEDRDISILVENVAFTKAFRLMLKSNRAFYRRIDSNSVIVAPDNAEKRGEYEDYLVRTFFLKSAAATEMADTLRQTLGLQNITANEPANSITIRDSEQRVGLAQQMINVNDRPQAEVVLQVEILEVNRTKAEQIGLDFGSQIRVSPPALKIGDFFPLKGLPLVLEGGAVTLPAVTFNYFKQDVNARTLANPSIRTVNRNEASIHIGDRVPLRSSTIVDATGQTRTTFDYRDVGIKLNVTPEMKLNQGVEVDINMEVSSLGQNLGTTDDPAFEIGTRNVTTKMILADGETAIIGGLISDEERSTVQKVPGLGEMPSLGRLFQLRDEQKTRTMILLTLTPVVIRPLQLPSWVEAEFYSGTGNSVTSESPFEFAAPDGGGEAEVIELDMGNGSGLQNSSVSSLAPPAITRPASAQGGERQAALGFGQSVYKVQSGSEVAISLTATGVAVSDGISAVMRFRKDLVEVVNVDPAAGVSYQTDSDKGEVVFDIAAEAVAGGSKSFAGIGFRALKPGLSYLVFARAGSGQWDLPSDVGLGASRIAIK